MPTSPFEISACSSNLKNESLTSNLEESLVSELDNRLDSNLESSISSVSATFSVINKDARSGSYTSFCDVGEYAFLAALIEF